MSHLSTETPCCERQAAARQLSSWHIFTCWGRSGHLAPVFGFAGFYAAGWHGPGPASRSVYQQRNRVMAAWNWPERDESGRYDWKRSWPDEIIYFFKEDASLQKKWYFISGIQRSWQSHWVTCKKFTSLSLDIRQTILFQVSTEKTLSARGQSLLDLSRYVLKLTCRKFAEKLW